MTIMRGVYIERASVLGNYNTWTGIEYHTYYMTVYTNGGLLTVAHWKTELKNSV
ncbi:hypothetical protein B0T17DRAFT_526133 [Bombardia bombarda]|uniref:Uncharacterized protein n=1 Tax=Bombardia bombarda TaxID=252184 RepID=A0AA40C9M6_9PEZI|nr:hypothetical protein B0T17DRAFT_526133 [Bombardia bombarda]